jgi:hypothetical protein
VNLLSQIVETMHYTPDVERFMEVEFYPVFRIRIRISNADLDPENQERGKNAGKS